MYQKFVLLTLNYREVLTMSRTWEYVLEHDNLKMLM